MDSYFYIFCYLFNCYIFVLLLLGKAYRNSTDFPGRNKKDHKKMNNTLKTYAKSQILNGLLKLPDGWQEKFKLMYGRNGGKRSVEDAKAMTIEEVVEEMSEEKLDWALSQIENSLKKLEKDSP